MRKAKTILTIMLGLTAFIASATDWTASLYYNFQNNSLAATSTKKIGQATNVLGSGQNLDLDGFIGAYLNDGTPVAGISLGKRFKFAEEVNGYAGLGISFNQGDTLEQALKHIGFGPQVGVTWRF